MIKDKVPLEYGKVWRVSQWLSKQLPCSQPLNRSYEAVTWWGTHVLPQVGAPSCLGNGPRAEPLAMEREKGLKWELLALLVGWGNKAPRTCWPRIPPPRDLPRTTVGKPLSRKHGITGHGPKDEARSSDSTKELPKQILLRQFHLNHTTHGNHSG